MHSQATNQMHPCTLLHKAVFQPHAPHCWTCAAQNSPSMMGTDTHTHTHTPLSLSLSSLPSLDPSPSSVHAKEVPSVLLRSYRNLQSPTLQAEQLTLFPNKSQSPSDGMQNSSAHLRAYALAPAHCPHGQAVVDQRHSGIRVIPRGSCSRWRLRQRIPAWTRRPILCPLMPRRQASGHRGGRPARRKSARYIPCWRRPPACRLAPISLLRLQCRPNSSGLSCC
jgi:hypothetical protein